VGSGAATRSWRDSPAEKNRRLHEVACVRVLSVCLLDNLERACWVVVHFETRPALGTSPLEPHSLNDGGPPPLLAVGNDDETAVR